MIDEGALRDHLRQLSPIDLAFLDSQERWLSKARDEQVLPTDGWSLAIARAGRGWGKALALDTPIPTPGGWKLNGDLVDGDVVFDERGTPCRVVCAHPVRYDRPCFRVEFSDGSHIVADAEHRWLTIDNRARKAARRSRVPRHVPEVVTTSQIAATLLDGRELNHAIPCAAALQCPDVDLPIDPYILGCWLGDGHAAGSDITTADPEVVEAFTAAGYTLTPRVSSNAGAAITYSTSSGRGLGHASRSLHRALRLLGLLNNKHIPSIYLRASAAQRQALLQGLFDTDGHCDAATGSLEFCSTSKTLAHGVLELALASGVKAVLYVGRASLNGRDCGPKYRVCFTAHRDIPFFRIERKLRRQRPRGAQAARAYRRYITAVVPVPSVPVRCLTVDSPSHLYLAGQAMIPTHNTEVGAQWSVRECGMYPGIVLHAVAPSHADLIGTMFNGISGIMNVAPEAMIEATNFSAAIPTIKFRNGSLIRGFSAQSPERLRGPQGSRVWGDELAAWGPTAEATLHNIDFSTRIAYRGADGVVVQPQRLYTTTPKPLMWLAEMLKKAQIVINGSTYDNRANLAEDFLRDIAAYEGTSIGRQEIHGELLDISEAAIIKQSWLRIWPNARPLPWFDFVMVVMDTAFTERTFDKKTFEADPTCCHVYGVFSHERRWNMMLLDRWSDHVGFPELVRRAKAEMQKRYGHRQAVLFTPLIGASHVADQEKRPDLLMIEDRGSGISLRQMLASEGIESWPYNPGRADKLSRLHSVSHVAAGPPMKMDDGTYEFVPGRGRIWLPESTRKGKEGTPRNWVLPMLDEVCVYSGPGTTKHDDDVDCFSMACRYFADRWLSSGVEGTIRPNSQVINVSPELTGGEEWIEREDRLPGAAYEEDFVNPYG